MTPQPSTDELVRDLHRRFSRLERAILGDPTVGHIGLVQRVEVLEAFQAKWVRGQQLLYGAAMGIGLASGFGGTWLFSAVFGG